MIVAGRRQTVNFVIVTFWLFENKMSVKKHARIIFECLDMTAANSKYDSLYV